MKTSEDTTVTTTEPKSEHVHLSRRNLVHLQVAGGLAFIALILGINKCEDAQAIQELAGLNPTPANAERITAHLLRARTADESLQAVEVLTRIGGKTALDAFMASLKSKSSYPETFEKEADAAGAIATKDPTQKPAARLLVLSISKELTGEAIPSLGSHNTYSQGREQIAKAVADASLKLGDPGPVVEIADNGDSDIRSAITPVMAHYLLPQKFQCRGGP